MYVIWVVVAEQLCTYIYIYIYIYIYVCMVTAVVVVGWCMRVCGRGSTGEEVVWLV